MSGTDAVVASAIESAVLGPDDVLVLVFDRMNAQEYERVKAVIDEQSNGLRGRVLIVGGAKALVAVGAAKAVVQ